ncbi:TetR/AcrR family transcriptional regulator [Actinomadura decatromicini]|uniref:TetR/AcrR family transcriptional regulator n=1 Tax=Actinomadura decatromicini TaxID=2604572 RepID=A0A5D3FKQ6_9ACTN|nr:TetR/AcrR family transcriptional regulator [Actinomadura decatromicini]TYK47765.1 TetR/AcrR family transcriptional regulator [Actinomadura decatromicini]
MLFGASERRGHLPFIRTRRPRRDAEANRERLLAAAVTAMLRDGRNVPLAAIAAEAGVGVGTLYRRYPDRQALLHDLEHRAYDLLVGILEEIDAEDRTGRDAVADYLARCLAVADQLVLPLRGAPPLTSAEAVRARRTIYRFLDAFLARGRADGTVRADVNATDVIVFSALVTQALAHGPNWPWTAERQIAIFVTALAAGGPPGVPRPEITLDDVEAAFAAHAAPSSGDGRGPS